MENKQPFSPLLIALTGFIIFFCFSCMLCSFMFGGTAQIEKATSEKIVGTLKSDPVLTNTQDGPICTMVLDRDGDTEVFKNVGSLYYVEADVATPCTLYKTGDSISGTAVGFAYPRLGIYRSLVLIEPVE